MELLEKHFDIAFAAPDGIKRLRELILTLAMQGKLVPQDPCDQPASELLKEIEAEKRRLVKAGKIKAPKPLPEITPAEVPYELPKGWQWVRLNDVGIWKSGSTPSRQNNAYYGGNIPWVKSGEVKQGRIKSTEEQITREAFSNCSLHLNPVGSVLIAMYGANIGDVGILEIEATTNQAICACKPYSNIFNLYLSHLLISLKKAFIAQGAGAAQPNISREKIVATVVPLPPLAEQRRIVARIDQLMARCDELEKLRAEQEQKRLDVHTAALNQLLSAQESGSFTDAWQFITRNFGELYSVRENVAELRKAILQLAAMGKLVPQDPNDQPASELLKEIEAEKKRLVKAGKIKTLKPLQEIKPEEVPYGLPQGWEWCRIWDVAQLITSGSRDWAQYYSESGAIFVTMGNLSRGNYQLRMDTMRYVMPPEDGEGLRTKLEENDLLISITGDVGNLGLIPANFGDAYINQHTCLLRFMPACRNRYFPELLKSPLAKLQFDAPQRGIKNSFRLSDVGEMIIPLPPIAEQHRIVAKIDHLMARCDELDQQITNSQGLLRRLLDAAVVEAIGIPLNGEIMSTTGNDEKIKLRHSTNVAGLKEIELSIKKFTLRNFSMTTGYRSLLKLECLFHSEEARDSEVSPVCLVGLNGSGKSNLIEAVADVFCFLELINLPWKRTSSDSSKYKRNDHFFELEYDLETNDGIEQVVIKKNKKAGVEFYVRDESGELKVIPQGIEQLKLLPRRVIGYSSGLNETVSHPFLRTKTLYSEEVRDAAPKSGTPISASKNVIDTRTLYMDYESNAAILICNYIFKSAEELSVINDYTRVTGVKSFTLRFNKKRAGRSGEGSIVRLTSELDSALKSFLRCAENESLYDPDRESYDLDFKLDDKTVSRFKREFSSAEALFMAMHKWSLLNALVLSDAQRTVYLKEDVTKGTLERPPSVPPKDRIFNIADLKLNLSTPAITIDYSGLSDGEHQFIQVVGTVILFSEPGSLFLFDEPESHFNPEWRTKFNVILNSLPNAKFHEFMISTHSPFLVSGSRGFNVFKFERHGANVSCEPVKFETYGASFDDLLNKLFGVESMIDQSARAELEEIIRSGNKEAMETAVGNFAESREKRRLYQALIEKGGK